MEDEVKYETHRDQNDHEEQGDYCEMSVSWLCLETEVGSLLFWTNTKHILVRISQLADTDYFILDVVKDTEHKTRPSQQSTDPNYF